MNFTIDQTHRYIAGVSSVALFGFCAPLHLCFLLTIYTTQSLWKFVAYRIIFHVCILNLLHVLTTLELGILILTLTKLPVFLMAMGGMLNWYVFAFLGIFSFVQALNRFAVIWEVRLLMADRIYSALLLLCWTVAILSVAVSFLFGTAKFELITISFAWYARTPNDVNWFVNNFYMYTVPAFLIISGCLYVLCVLKLATDRGSIDKRDIALLPQTIVPFVFLVLGRLMNFFPHNMIVVVLFFMRSVPVLYVITYLVFNRTLRHAVMKTFRWRVKTNVVKVSVTQLASL